MGDPTATKGQPVSETLFIKDTFSKSVSDVDRLEVHRCVALTGRFKLACPHL